MGWRSEDFELACLTLDEILSPAYAPLPIPRRDHALSEKRLRAWLDQAAAGDETLFRKRLARDNLDFEDITARLGGVTRSQEHRPPAWVGSSTQVLARLRAADEAAELTAPDLPFAPLFWPLVVDATNALTQQLSGNPHASLSDKARDDLISVLAERLGKLCELPFYEALMGWRKAHAEAATTDITFAAFTAYMRATGFDLLFTRYPVLLRLLAEIRDQWLETSEEFVARLAADNGLIRAQTWGPSTQDVIAIESGLSDFHDGGRAVLTLTFANGVKVVYKPKTLTTDKVVGDIARLLAEPALGLRIPKFLARDGYGWCEHVASIPCGDAEEVALYFRRAGAWLAIFHLLSASDMHMENIIASGATPVPVDFETILQGCSWRPKALSPDLHALWMVSDFLERSVITVGMLPAYVRDENDGLISVGGIEPSRTSVARVAWRDVNSVWMRPHSETVEREVATNLPVLNGQPQAIFDHRQAFLRGAREAWEAALARRQQLIELLEQAAPSLQVRRVFRPTRFYYMLVKRLSTHRQMSDGVCWSAQSEFIARLFDWEDDAEEPWKIFRHERSALLRLNIPAFHVDADKAVVRGPQGDITNLHMDSGLVVARARVEELDQAEMTRQQRIMATSLQVSTEDRPALAGPSACAPADVATLVADHLERRAFRTEGAMAWLGLDLVDHQKFAQLAPLGFDLYGGTSGIAIFFAALARTRNNENARRQAYAAVAASRHQITSHNAGRLTRSMSIGGGVGVGSMVYAFAALAEIFEDPGLAGNGVEAARLLDTEAILADDRFDLMAGSAGACLGLLRLHRALGAPHLLEQARLCVEHLERRRVDFSPSGLWSSKAFENHPLTGLSHGAAGYALAFSKLYAATGEPRYRALAHDCVAFENAAFDVGRNTWPDLRRNPDTGELGWPNQWCYGAIGIGYGRLSMLKDGALAEGLLRTDIERAVQAAEADWPQVNDTLCCGAAGTIDFLLEAGRRLDRPELIDLARSRMREVVDRLRRDGDFVWDLGAGDYNLGLHRGVAGIGLVALRLENPAIPAIAVWE